MVNIYTFDYFNNIRSKTKVLCNPDMTEIGLLNITKDVRYTLSFETMSKLTFKVPYQDSMGNTTPYYDLIKTKRIIKVEDFGSFVIKSVNDEGDGISRYKVVECNSYEDTLVKETLTILDGVYNFYSPINPEKTIMGIVMEYLPNWSIGQIDSDLWNIYRAFEVKTENIYSFLKNTLEETMECVFTFDTVNMKINAQTINNALHKTDIYMSYSNVVKKLGLKENDNEFLTALSVYGGGDLDIRAVNPLGTNTIYDFSYFIANGWMNKDLENAVVKWQNKVDSKQKEYADLLRQLKGVNGEYISMVTQLVEKENKLKAYELRQSVMIEGQQSHVPEYTKLLSDIRDAEKDISNHKSKMKAKDNEIKNIKQNILAINKSLSFEENFTQEQRAGLKAYIHSDSYVDEHIIITEIMNSVEIQEAQQELYDSAKNVLKEVSQPRYQFTIDTTNFIKIPEFKKFSNQLRLGSEVTVDMDNGLVSYPILLGITIDEGDSKSFQLRFGNSLRDNNSEYSFLELFGDTVQASKSVQIDSEKWSRWVKSGASDEWTEFKNSVLDASKKEIVSSENQDFRIDQTGLRGRKYNPNTDRFEDEQLWMINNLLCFTDDNWNTVKEAIGKLTLPNGQIAYGVIAEAIIGKLIIGNELLIENNNKSFVVNGDGATLTNASMSLITKDGKSRILLDPDNAIRIQKKVGNSYEDQFYVDVAGNAVFKGDIVGSTITGSTIYIGEKSRGTYIVLEPNTPFEMYLDGRKQIELWADRGIGGYVFLNDDSGREAFRVQAKENGFTMMAGDIRSGSEIDIYSQSLNFHGGGDYPYFYLSSDLIVTGDAEVRGDKNAVVSTNHYGDRLLYAEESDRAYFSTKGIGKTDNGIYIIRLDDMFFETIEPNSVCRYIPIITPFKNVNIWIDKVYDKYVIVKSDEDCEFSYSIQCTRKGYKDVYLEESSIAKLRKKKRLERRS